jgi:putative PIN family toxin of toxin-antitoxin system
VIRATLDTNILASGAIARKGTIAKLFNRWRSSDFELVVSEHVLMELERALRKPYFAARLDQPDRQDFVSLILEFATVVELSDPIPTALPDVADNLILATALSGGASHLVSGDRALQRLGQFLDVQILSAHQFLSVIAGEQALNRTIEQ